jgi:hypothetical protein
MSIDNQRGNNYRALQIQCREESYISRLRCKKLNQVD